MKKTLIQIACAALMLSSCINSETVYSVCYIGNVSGMNTIVDDDGEVLQLRSNPVLEDSSYPKKAGTRIYYFYNQYGRTDKGEIDAAILSFLLPLTKKPLELTTAPDTLAAKPILPLSGNYGGGYINLELGVYTDGNGKTEHTINIVHDDTRADGDTVYFFLKHDTAFEDPVMPEETQDAYVARFLSSFPVYEYVVNKEKPVIVVEYPWYDFEHTEDRKPLVRINKTVNFEVDKSKYVQEYVK